MNLLLFALTSTFLVSLISLCGILIIIQKKSISDKILLSLVGFSAGTLFGGAFLHLIPESLEFAEDPLIFVLVGFSLFFIIEKFLHWHHCHNGKCAVHTFTYMSIIGDSIHNFIDGLTIVASFMINLNFGIITTLAVILHELPQELGDFAILVYGGVSKLKSVLFNFLTALTAMIGALVGYFFLPYFENIIPYLLSFAAGGFIYISASDLIPELHKESNIKKSVYSFLMFILGICLVILIKIFFKH